MPHTAEVLTINYVLIGNLSTSMCSHEDTTKYNDHIKDTKKSELLQKVLGIYR